MPICVSGTRHNGDQDYNGGVALRFFRPNIEKMMRKRDVDSLVRVVDDIDEDVVLRRKAAAALASLINAKEVDFHKKTDAIEAFGRFRDDVVLEPLLDFGDCPLWAVRALALIGSSRAIEALRTVYLLHSGSIEDSRYGKFHVDSAFGRSLRHCIKDMTDRLLSELEEALLHHGDYEGCKGIIRRYSESHKDKASILGVIRVIMRKPEAQTDKELLMIFLKCLGAFKAADTWVGSLYDCYYWYDIDDYGREISTEEKLIAHHITPGIRASPAGGDLPITLEEFREYLINLDQGILEDEEILNQIVSLLPEYPSNLEGNPIAAALQRVGVQKRTRFLDAYLKRCESPPPPGLRIRGSSLVDKVVHSLRYWLSYWEKP